MNHDMISRIYSGNFCTNIVIIEDSILALGKRARARTQAHFKIEGVIDRGWGQPRGVVSQVAVAGSNLGCQGRMRAPMRKTRRPRRPLSS